MIDPAPFADAYAESVTNLKELRDLCKEAYGSYQVHLGKTTYRTVNTETMPVLVERIIAVLGEQAKVNAMLVAALDELAPKKPSRRTFTLLNEHERFLRADVYEEGGVSTGSANEEGADGHFTDYDQWREAYEKAATENARLSKRDEVDNY